ncbi:MAG TPA: hypothetical protein VKO83_02510 [Steroidobacteraceae bacterium]|nr:hypothetical protein [Steroidobacteraceae bacterium]
MKAVLSLVVLLGLSACGREPESDAPSKSSAAATTSRTGDESVAAVAQSPGTPAISLRFALVGKPRTGAAMPLRLDLAGVPGQVTLHLQGEGLVIDPQAASLTLPEGGSPISQSVSVTPNAAGITELVVRIQPPGDGAQEIVYAVPLLVEDSAAR